MTATKSIDLLAGFLTQHNLSWLLPNLRQDLVIWKAINNQQFLSEYLTLVQQGQRIFADTFSPIRLALFSMGQYDLIHKEPWELINSIDNQASQSVYESLREQSEDEYDTQDLQTVCQIAIALENTQRKTNSWSTLIQLIQQRPEVDWSSPLVCLYGLTTDPSGLINELVQPGASINRIDLAIHIILSNPIRSDDQVTMFMTLCKRNDSKLLPPRERLLLVNRLFEQRPKVAVDFCNRWLEDKSDVTADHKHPSMKMPEILLHLEENLFQVEINRISGTIDHLGVLLAHEQEIINNISTCSLITRAYILAENHYDNSISEELVAIQKRLILPESESWEDTKSDSVRATLALILAEQGLVEDACQLVPIPHISLPEDPILLYTLAIIALKAGNNKVASDSVDKLLEVLEQPATGTGYPVWGDGFSLMSLGRLLLELKQPDRASRIFERACSICPNDTNILSALSESYQSAQKNNEAAETFRVLVNLEPGEFDYHRKFARSLEAIHDWEEALKEHVWMIDSLREQSKSLPADDVYAYANCALHAHKPELIVDICNNQLAQNEDDCQALIYCGKAFIELGNYDGGVEYLFKATQAGPHLEYTWLALIEAYNKSATTDQVKDILIQACHAVPNSAQFHFTLGELYLRENAPSLALPELKLAKEISPEDSKILFGYGKALKQLGHVDECRGVLTQAFQLDPTLPELAAIYAELLINMGEFEEAISPLENLISSNTYQQTETLMNYARCILSVNQKGAREIPPMKALAALNQVLQNDPDKAEAKALIAEILSSNGDNEMAFHAYREALDTSLVEDQVWLERLSFGFGRVSIAIGKHDIAIAALQEAIQVNPINTQAFKALSDAYLSSHLVEDAIKVARNVLVIDGNDPENLSWFAKQAWKVIHTVKVDPSNQNSSAIKSLPSEAINALAKAIHLSPSRTDLLIQLGYLQENLGAHTEALATFRAISTLEFVSPDDLVSASDFLSSNGDYPGAIACIKNAISQNDNVHETRNPYLHVRLAREFVNNNDHPSAINSLDDGLAIFPDNELLLKEKISLLLHLGQSMEALNCIDTAIQNNSDKNADLFFLAARVSHAIGDLPTALKSMQKGIESYSRENGIENLSRLPTQYLTHITEIFRGLLQHNEAYKLLQEHPPVSVSDFSSDEEYLDYICLHTELALDTGQAIRSDIQDILPESSNPKFSRFMAITARLMNKAGNYKQAVQIFQIAINTIRKNENAHLQPNWTASYSNYLTNLSLLAAAVELGMWKEALNIGQNVLEASPSEPLSYLNFASILVLRAEYSILCDEVEVSKHKPHPETISPEVLDEFCKYQNSAKSSLQGAREIFKIHGYELTDELIYRWQSRAEIAFQEFSETNADPSDILLVESTPADAVAFIRYIYLTSDQSRDKNPINEIIKIARAFPRNPAVFLQVALAIYDENPAEAMKSLQSILDQNPTAKNPNIAFCNVLLAKIAQKLQEHRLARTAILNAIDFWNDEPAWHALAAQIYQMTCDINNVITHLAEATRLDPENVLYLIELGRVYLDNAYDDLRVVKQAASCFEHVLEKESRNVQALFYLATSQCHLNELEKAEENARSALFLEPNNAEFYSLLSQIALKNMDNQGAYEYASKAFEINPKDAHSTIMLIRSLSALGRNNEALAKINALLPSVADPKTFLLERADLITKISSPRAGIKELEILLRTYPDDFGILNSLAKLFIGVGEPESAVAHALKALQMTNSKITSNEQANLHLLIGQVLRQSGQMDESIDHLLAAIELAPDRLEPYLELGLARKERREYQQALQIFEQATKIDPDDPRAPYQAGLALKESKDYKSSETMLRRAVSLAPNDINIRRQLAAVVALNLVHNPRSGRS